MSTKKIQLLENIFPADPQAGQVLSVDADGNKVWSNQYIMDGTLTPGYQYNSSLNAHLFVIDITNSTPDIGTYYFNGGSLYIRVVKDGSNISQQMFGSVKQIQLNSINPSGNKSGIELILTFDAHKKRYSFHLEDNQYVTNGTYSANTWYQTAIQYSSSQVDDLLSSKLDSPTNDGSAGQVPVYQEGGTTVWGDMPSIDGLATETYVDNKVSALVNSAPETLDTLNELAAALGNDENFATTVATQISAKVDKVEGKGLSTEDYTTEEKTKLAGISEGAEVNVQSDWNETDTTSDAYIANKPAIPSKTSDITNDSGFLTSVPDEYVTETELTAKGYLTTYTETDPTVPDWAKAATKPVYTAAEVGALPNDTVIPSIDGLASETYVNNAVAGVNAVPSSTTADNDKILMVVDGVPTWVAITNAEGVAY